MDRSRVPVLGVDGVQLAVGLGSNLGDRLANLRFGLSEMRRFLQDVQASAVFETPPMGIVGQPRFLNACCTGHTHESASAVLQRLQRVEMDAGRRPDGIRNGPRMLDLDLLLFGESVIERQDLRVPHPRLRERAFVLIPLAEIAGDWVVPAAGPHLARTVRALVQDVDATGIERLIEQL